MMASAAGCPILNNLFHKGYGSSFPVGTGSGSILNMDLKWVQPKIFGSNWCLTAQTIDWGQNLHLSLQTFHAAKNSWNLRRGVGWFSCRSQGKSNWRTAAECSQWSAGGFRSRLQAELESTQIPGGHPSPRVKEDLPRRWWMQGVLA